MEQFFQTLGIPFLACVVLVSILSYLGMHVLSREIIFIDIAFAQIATVGAIAAHMLLDAESASFISLACSFAAVLAAAMFFAAVRTHIVHIPLEAVIGVSYAVAAASALFLIGAGPGGHVHVQEMLSGSILWATWSDILQCTAAFAAVGGCFILFRKPFEAISADYEEAVRKGLRVMWWDLLFYVLFGIVITFSVRVAGIVAVFTFLVIPASISALFTPRWGTRLGIAWASGTLASLACLAFSQRLDFSVGPSVAMFLGVLLVLSACWNIARKRLGTRCANPERRREAGPGGA